MTENISKTASELVGKIYHNSKVVIFSHVNPDGDAIGSTLGLYHFLKSKTSHVQVIMPNRFPDFLKFLPGTETIRFFDKEPKELSETISQADFLFFLDFNDPARVEKMGEIALKANGLKILIDHHPEPKAFADYSISDVSVCSTAELVFEFVINFGNPDFSDKNMANCLMAGIITDTGLFNHNSENRRTFEIVGKLLDMGADKANIIQKIYNEYPFHRMQLLGNALHNRFKFYEEFGTAFIYLPKEDLEKYNHKIGDTEGFVNIALSVAGANFSAIFLEKEDHVKCSFRSVGNFDVNQFARNHYHGGGHKNASGGKSFESLTKTIENFVELIEKYKDEIKQA